MTVSKTLFSSKSTEWETPQEFFAQLDAEFHFCLDACATRKNAKCKTFIDKDSLNVDWAICSYFGSQTIWVNPPYGRQIGLWVQKALDTSQKGRTVVCLLPARTDTAWWHESVIGGNAEVRFVKGRLKFSGAKNSAPFPSAVVIFRGTPP